MNSDKSECPAVTVSIVARTEERRIAACVASIAVQDYPNFTVTLVDDGSTDRTVALARAALPSIRTISSPTRSISRNREIGWRDADTAFVAYLDADCEAPPNWLSSLMSAALDTGAAAVGGGNRPPLGESAHYDALALMLQTFAGSRGSLQGRIPEAGRVVKHLPGLNVLFRTDALRLVGGYDPRFARMGEDEDLSHRLTNLGLNLYVTPDATVIHRQRADLASWARNMRAYGRGRTWLLRRHPNIFSATFLVPPLTIPGIAIYLPFIAIYSAWTAVRARRPNLLPRLFLLFVATHLAYGLGQVEGLFVRGDNELAKRRRDRLAIVALKNSGNKGDEAICLAVTNRLNNIIRRSGHEIDIYVSALGPSGFDVRPIPSGPDGRALMITDMLTADSQSRKLRASAILHAGRLLSVLIGFRAIVIGGGQWLHDLNLSRHAITCVIFAFARSCRTKTGVFCVGVGPLRRRSARMLIRAAFAKNSMLITRDEASAELLRACGQYQARSSTDPALELTSPKVLRNQGLILISPCAWVKFENTFVLNDLQIQKSLTNLKNIVAGIRDRGDSVALLPTMNPEDTNFAHAIAKDFGDVEIIKTNRLSPAEVQAHIAAAKALVSMRLHPLIFAYNVNTPFVALNCAAKIPAFCEQIGLRSRVVDIDTTEWAEDVLNLLSIPAIGPTNETMRSELLSELDNSYRTFFNWLTNSTAGAQLVYNHAM